MVYGDRGYRGCEGVIVCDSREMRAKRQVVEGVISQIKLFNAGSGWRTITCVLVYVYAYAIGYSYYRRGELEDRSDRMEKVLKDLAKEDSKIAEALKRAGLLSVSYTHLTLPTIRLV